MKVGKLPQARSRIIHAGNGSPREGLSALLSFTDAERGFLDLLLDKGKIDSTILTSDTILQKCIQGQPLLEWKALNMRRHKGLT